MQDMQAYLEKLSTEAVDCALISKRATDLQKRVLFNQLADHLAMLASVLERVIEAKGPQWIISLVPLSPAPDLVASPCRELAESCGMLALTRRRDPDAYQETWLVYHADAHAVTIGLRSGNPFDTDQWQWRCGFYPGSRPGERKNGTEASYEAARSAFSRRLARVSVEPNRG